MNARLAALAAGSLLLAGVSGFMVASAIGATAPPPEKTVTVTIPNNATGPTGPTGATGPEGGITCPTGFVPGVLIVNHPGGQVSVYACLK